MEKLAQESREEKLERKLAEANQKIRILENMVENQTRELYYTNLKSIAFLESAPDAMIISDKTGRIILVNAQTERLFGYSRDDLNGKEVELLIPGFFKGKPPEYWKQYVVDVKVRVMSQRAGLFGIRRDRAEFPVEISVSPVIIDGDLFVCAAIRDVTDQKRAAEELRAYAGQLETSNKELEQFAFVASHDLQEPLKTITNYTGLFQTKYVEKLDKETLVFLEYIVKSADRMKSLITALLDFSRIGHDRILVDVDCGEMVNDVLDKMQTLIRDNNAVVNVGSMLHIHASKTEVKQVFQHLIGNAIKFKKEGQQVVIDINCKSDEGSIVCSVADNGIGVPEEYREKIFLIFQRLHGVDKYPGTGIGLAICRKIISLYNGKIWLESQPGKGSTVFFSIPKAEGEKA